MRTAKECLRQAEHAEKLALKTSDSHSKAILLEIAQNWRELIGKDSGLAERTANYREIQGSADDGR
jgi:hypothetical protein